ncbi:hypothetical protein HAX54_035191 [Datura stramonium]|uniref:Uncharacterized protein n=1 Tax=Datura stramonium TaxID=4076 RepID=A0ABS8SF88_DATST|nr:hypothetical protein [Datura stramonium]
MEKSRRKKERTRAMKWRTMLKNHDQKTVTKEGNGREKRGEVEQESEETQEEEHEDFAETHRWNKMEKEGLSPMKRIRSRHRKKNGRRTREKTAPTHKEGGSNGGKTP